MSGTTTHRIQPIDAAIAAWFGVAKVEPERNFMRDRMAAAVGAFLAADPNVDQIIYALERAEKELMARANALDRLDYSAEFFTEDAARMREAIRATDRSQRQSSCPNQGLSGRMCGM